MSVAAPAEHSWIQPLDDLLPVPQQYEHSSRLDYDYDFCDPLDEDWLDVDFAYPTQYYPDVPAVAGERRLAILGRDVKIYLAQTWLFYGLLSSFLRKRVQKSDVFYDQYRVGGPTLTAWFHEWHRDLCDMEDEPRQAEMSRLNYLLRATSDTVSRLDLCFAEDGSPTEPHVVDYELAWTLLCVKLLAEYLSHVLAAYRHAQDLVRKRPSSKIAPWFEHSLKLAQNAAHAWPSEIEHLYEGEWSKVFSSVSKPGEPVACNWSGRLLQQWFHENGWCGVALRLLSQVHNYTTMYYLSRTRRLEARGTHNMCQQSQDCLAYELSGRERGQYQPQHSKKMNATCDCPLVPSAIESYEDKLCDMIDNDIIPILSIRLDLEDLDIRLEPYDGTMRYTAISHVWSDGMGNDRHNQIYKCQLQAIGAELVKMERQHAKRQFLNTVTPYNLAYQAWSSIWRPRVYFWLDTLCIPAKTGSKSMDESATTQRGVGEDWAEIVDSEGESTDPECDSPQPVAKSFERRQELRKLAMRHITPIFQACEQVLVIDKEIEQLSHPTHDVLAAMLLGSKWAHRAWTFQEGSTARDCRFKILCGDPAVLRDLYDRDWDEWAEGNVSDLALKPNPNVFVLYSAMFRIYTNTINLNGIQISQFWVPFKTVLAESLNDFRRNYARTRESFFSVKKEANRYRSLQSITFAESWNNVKDRKATRPSDTDIIFSNLLDFNTTNVLDMTQTDRLPAIVQSCSTLPLSIFFNTKTKVYRYPGVHFHMLDRKDLWIPNRIEGDNLKSGDILENESVPEPVDDHQSVWGVFKSRLLTRNEVASNHSIATSPWLQYKAHKSDTHLKFLITTENTEYGQLKGPTTVELLVKENESEDHSYIMELCLPHRRLKRNRRLAEGSNPTRKFTYGPRITDEDREAFYTQASSDFSKGKRVLYILDESLGSDVPSGYRGRGARFSVLEKKGHRIYVQFDCPLIFWDTQQWSVVWRLYKMGESRKTMKAIKARHVKKDEPRIYIQHDVDSLLPPISTREMRIRPVGNLATVVFTAAFWIPVAIAIVITVPITLTRCPRGITCYFAAMASTLAVFSVLGALAAFFSYRVYYRWRTATWLKKFGVTQGKKSDVVKTTHVRESATSGTTKRWSDGILTRVGSRRVPDRAGFELLEQV